MRIDKYLSDMGIGTRGEIKKALRKKRLLVNGEVIKDIRRRGGKKMKTARFTLQ